MFSLSLRLKQGFQSCFHKQLQKYLSYKDVLYLKIILQRSFDHLRSNFAIGGTIWAVETKMCVHISLEKGYKNMLSGVLFSSYTSMYLWKYSTHKSLLYLKIILKRFCFDNLNCKFALRGTVWAVETKTRVHFFWDTL